MSKLHELLAAEKTPNAAWNQLYEDTLKKFKNPSHFFDGHSKSLKMIEGTPENEVIEQQAREEKPVTTSVYETLEYALDIYGKAEDLQFQKNKTNQIATGDVEFNGQVILKEMPVDELLGLEARLVKIRQLIGEVPTLDATKHWIRAENISDFVWQTEYPDETTKTDKQVIPVVMAEATHEHPAQVQAVGKDVVVGKYSITRRSGSATAFQKAEAIKRIDNLLVEIKQARMRANETEAEKGKVSDIIISLILEPFKV